VQADEQLAGVPVVSGQPRAQRVLGREEDRLGGAAHRRSPACTRQLIAQPAD
jgi:hypothetical protein